MKLKSLALLLMTIAMPAMAEQVSVNSKGISLILDVENGKPAQYLYFGSKLNAADLQNLTVATNGRMDAYPAYGLNTPAEAALAMRHSDGNLSTALVATDSDDTPLKDWVQTNNITYDALFVPSGTSLKIEDFKKFNEARKAFIVEHLKKIIG